MKQLYSLDQFIDTIKGMPKYRKVSNVALAGFRAKMKSQDMLYVFEPKAYLEELDKYLEL